MAAFELFPQLIDEHSNNFLAYNELLKLHNNIIAYLIQNQFRQFIPNMDWMIKEVFNYALNIIIGKYNDGKYEHRSHQTFYVYCYSVYRNSLHDFSRQNGKYELTIDDKNFTYLEIPCIENNSDWFDAYHHAIQKVPFKNEQDRVILNEAILSGSSKKAAEEFNIKSSKVRVMKKRKLPILIQLMKDYDNDLMIAI